MILGIIDTASGQHGEQDISTLWQTYYLNQDANILEKTIHFLNETPMSQEQLMPLFIGFYGALFDADTLKRERFVSLAPQIKKAAFVELFQFIDSINIDTFYQEIEMSPAYNDMNWASFFATGNVKYLDNIIANIPYWEERKDLTLFLTGGTAKWSLASNATQDKLVKSHLQSIKKKTYGIKEILSRDPNTFQDEMTKILKEQKAAGIWK